FFSSASLRPPRSPLFPYTSSSDLRVRVLARASDLQPSRAHRLPEPAGHDRAGLASHAAASQRQLREVDPGPSPLHPELHQVPGGDRKSTRLNSSHVAISYAVFCLK